MFYIIRPTEEDIQHHGVQGQSWGIRNGPPYPLNIKGKAALNRQKKKNSKALVKAYKDKDREKMGKLATEAAKSYVSDNTLYNLSRARDKINKFSYDDEWEESEEYKKATKEAFENTLNWYKKNDPETLKTMLDKVNGDTGLLDQFHDFRKTQEGFHDEALEKYEKVYNANHKEALNAFNEYNDALDAVTEDIVGKFKDTPLSKGSNSLKLKYVLPGYIDMNELLYRGQSEADIKKKK